MRRTLFLSIVLSLLVAPVAIAAVDRSPVAVTPSGTTVVVPGVAVNNAPPLEVITILHYKNGKAKPENPGNGNSNKPKGESCYGFISGKAKLIATEDVLINPTNTDMTEADVMAQFEISANVWDDETSASVYGSFIKDYTANFDSIADGKNEISFGNYPTSGVIAVTRVWGWFSGKPDSRYISQFDMQFDTDFTWGDADIDATVMDFKNIAIHELGHTLGLADIYTETCADVTMYGYSDYGETTKRTLEPADIQGLQTLYGI